MTAIIELCLRILAPIVELIFKLIGKNEIKKKQYKEAVDGFQDIEQTTLSEEQKALKVLNETNS